MSWREPALSRVAAEGRSSARAKPSICVSQPPSRSVCHPVNSRKLIGGEVERRMIYLSPLSDPLPGLSVRSDQDTRRSKRRVPPLSHRTRRPTELREASRKTSWPGLALTNSSHFCATCPFELSLNPTIDFRDSSGAMQAARDPHKMGRNQRGHPAFPLDPRPIQKPALELIYAPAAARRSASPGTFPGPSKPHAQHVNLGMVLAVNPRDPGLASVLDGHQQADHP